MSRRLGADLVRACLASVLVAAPFTPTTLGAQLPGTHFTIAAGAAFPTGDFGTDTDVGYNIAAGIGVTQRGSPIGFRVEGMYNEFNQSGFGDKAHAAAITGNATYDFSGVSLAPTATLYLIGGAGYYNTHDPFFDIGNQSNIGWNIGGGFRFPLTGFSAYVEARFHSVTNTEVRFIPVVFGLVF